MLAIGLIYKQFILACVFGGIPIAVSALLFFGDWRKKHTSKPASDGESDSTQHQQPLRKEQPSAALPSESKMTQLYEKAIENGEFEDYIIGRGKYLALSKVDYSYSDFTLADYKLTGINGYINNHPEEADMLQQRLLSALKKDDFLITFAVYELLLACIKRGDEFPFEPITVFAEVLKLLAQQKQQMKDYKSGMFICRENGMYDVIQTMESGTIGSVLHKVYSAVGEDAFIQHVSVSKDEVFGDFAGEKTPCLKLKGWNAFEFTTACSNRQEKEVIASEKEAVNRFAASLKSYCQ